MKTTIEILGSRINVKSVGTNGRYLETVTRNTLRDVLIQLASLQQRLLEYPDNESWTIGEDKNPPNVTLKTCEGRGLGEITDESLEKAEWVVGDTDEFLNVVPDEDTKKLVFGLIESVEATVRVDVGSHGTYVYVKYPEETTITVTHKKGRTDWLGINVKKEHLKDIVLKWKDVLINIDKNDEWSKTIDGYKFMLTSYTERVKE